MSLSIAEAMIVARRVSFKHPALEGLSLKVDEDAARCILRLVVSYRVPDRNTGHRVPILKEQEFRPYDLSVFRDVKDWLNFLEHFVREVFAHEFLECFHLDGRRRYDPHPREAANDTEPRVVPSATDAAVDRILAGTVSA